MRLLLHFLGKFDFKMKTVYLNKSETRYPINIHDFDLEDT